MGSFQVFFSPAASEMVGSRDVYKFYLMLQHIRQFYFPLKIFSCRFSTKKSVLNFLALLCMLFPWFSDIQRFSWIAPFARTSSLRTPRIGALLPQLSSRSFRSCWWCQLPFALQGKVVSFDCHDLFFQSWLYKQITLNYYWTTLLLGLISKGK